MSQRPTLIAPSRPDGNIQESPRLAHPHMHVGVGLPVQVRQPPVAPPTLKPVVALPSGIARPPPINNPKPEPFAKLSLTCIKGMDIKAGQGLNVEADPYVILKLGDQECISKPDNKGGKNPVSHTTNLKFEQKHSLTTAGHSSMFNRYGTKNSTLTLLMKKNCKSRFMTSRPLQLTNLWDVVSFQYWIGLLLVPLKEMSN